MYVFDLILISISTLTQGKKKLKQFFIYPLSFLSRYIKTDVAIPKQKNSAQNAFLRVGIFILFPFLHFPYSHRHILSAGQLHAEFPFEGSCFFNCHDICMPFLFIFKYSKKRLLSQPLNFAYPAWIFATKSSCFIKHNALSDIPSLSDMPPCPADFPSSKAEYMGESCMLPP